MDVDTFWHLIVYEKLCGLEMQKYIVINILHKYFKPGITIQACTALE